MKIHLDHICAHLQVPAACRTVSIRIIVDNAEMVTEVLAASGKELVFPDIYEFALDELVFCTGTMPIEVDFFNMDTREVRTIGHGSANMCTLFRVFGEHVDFHVDLFDRNTHIGMVSIRGRINEIDSALAMLRQQQDEIAHLKQIYEQLATASRALEQEAAENLLMAQGQIEKLTKKHNELVNKYNELVTQFDTKEVELDEMKHTMDEMQLRVDSTTSELQKEQELSTHLHMKVVELENCVRMEKNLCGEKVSEVEEKEVTIGVLQQEITRLRAKLHNQSMALRSDSVHVETLSVNNIMTENVIDQISNNSSKASILRSQDIEVLRAELFTQLKSHEVLRQKNARLLLRLHNTAQKLLVCARTRPPSREEKENDALLIIDTTEMGASDLHIYDPDSNDWTIFEFDHHWSYDATQSDVFADVEPLVASVVPSLQELTQLRVSPVRARHAAVLGYGGRDSGKSFTLHGSATQPGISFRSVQKVFELLNLQKNALLLQKSSVREGAGTVSQVQYDFDVDLSAMEVWDDKVVDMLDDGPRRNLAGQVKFVNGQVNVEGLRRQKVQSAREALELLAATWQSITTRPDFVSRQATTALLLELCVSVRFCAQEGAIESRLLLAELPSVDAVQDANLRGFELVLEALGSDAKSVPFSMSPLTQVLQGYLGEDGRTMMIFTLAPTNLSVDVTRAVLQRSAQVRGIRRSVHALQSSRDTILQKKIELKLKSMQSELKASRIQVDEMNNCLESTRTVAEELVRVFNERNESCIHHYESEREISKQLRVDLELLYRNVKKYMGDLHNQKMSFDRLSDSLKALSDRDKDLSGIIDELPKFALNNARDELN